MTETCVPTSKVCSKCKQDKPLDEYHNHKEGKYGKNSKCKECAHKDRVAKYERTRDESRAYTAAWRAANPDRAKATDKRYREKNAAELAIRKAMARYNITRERYLELMAPGTCALCGYKPTMEDRDRLYLDHDHGCCPGNKSCGKCVRDPLCINCNLMLGHAKDSAALLRKAADYVDRWAQV